jgi:peptidoglycan/LPS O-acetylase OafA/YrhL
VLDGIRGIAWVTVFFSHALTLPFAMGQMAMFVFFALSGFLITGLLVEEGSGSGRVSLGRFFARRALRLLPALGFFLVGWLAVIVVVQGHAPWTTTVPGGSAGTGTSPTVALEGVAAALLYLTNWAEIGHWFTGYLPLGHLWSLAVEEQFYLLWSPVVAVFVARRSRVAVGWAAGLAAVASFVDVSLRSNGFSLLVDMSTDTRAGAFLAGALLGVAWGNRARWLQFLTAFGGRPAAAAALTILAWGSWAVDHAVPRQLFDITWASASVAAGVLVVALLAADSTGESRLVASPVATFIGRRSYGLYLWHYAWLTWLAGMGLAGIPVALFATFATAETSWRLVERPALALKARFKPSIPAGSDPARDVSSPARKAVRNCSTTIAL